MKDNPAENELILVEDVITAEERKGIIAAVEKDFSRSFDLGETARSESVPRGLVFPLITGIATILFTLVFLVFFLNSRSRDIDVPETVIPDFMGDTEWKILQHFKTQSEAELEKKNRRIDYYRQEIASYDKKLDVLKGLIESKRIIEDQLEEAIRFWLSDGLGVEEVEEKRKALEKELVASLSPSEVEHYDLNLNEINREIDRILGEKHSSEELLEEEIRRREELIEENDRLKASLAAEREQRAFSTAENIRDSYILVEYRELLRLLGEGEAEAAREKVFSLRVYLEEQRNSYINNDNLSLIDRDIESLNNLEERLLLFDSPVEIPAPVEVISTEPAGPQPIGKISSIRFNMIEITGATVPVGTVFKIVRKEGDEEILLGRGKITGQSPLSGQILSLSTTKFKPEAGDLLYGEEE
ncbi:MAG: hypothetical protein PQJ59_00130 [Spirochaetales bacterium]|nr:hypothetical protein [Spirochaetales bacterium]